MAAAVVSMGTVEAAAGSVAAAEVTVRMVVVAVVAMEGQGLVGAEVGAVVAGAAGMAWPVSQGNRTACPQAVCGGRQQNRRGWLLRHCRA